MRKMNQWIALALMATLGGCFFAYDYEPTAGTGGAGGGGVGASTANSSGSLGGGPAAQSSSGTPGTGGMGGMAGTGGTGGDASSSSGGMCTVTLCGVPLPTPWCAPDANAPCTPTDWAFRYGINTSEQRAHAIAMSLNNEVIVGGVYANEAVPLDPNGPTLAAGAGNNGFLIALNAEGTITRHTTIANADVVGVATDTQGRISAITHEGTADSYLKWWETLASAPANPTWSRKLQNIVVTGVAVGADTNIYVLGQAGPDARLETTMAPMTQVAAGMIVARYQANGSLTWAVPFQPMDASVPDSVHGAAITVNQGVWITGYFRKQLFLNAMPVVEGNDNKSMFLLRLTEVDGTLDLIRKRVNLGPVTGMGGVEPAAISVNGTGVYVVGKVRGPTVLDGDLADTEDAAFVTWTDTKNIEPDKHRVIRSELAGSMYGSRMTGVYAANERLYVAGTYSGAMKIEPAAKAILSPGAVGIDFDSPFVARLDPISLASLSFTPFPGGGESFLNANVHFAAANAQVGDHLVLAGAWTNTLDFRQGNLMRSDLLLTQPTPAAMPTTDIFVAHFTAP